MVRKWVVLGLFLVAVAGLVIGIIGLTTNRYTVKTKHFEVTYDLAEEAYYSASTGEKLEKPDQLVNFSSATFNQDLTNAEKEWDEVPKLAKNKHSTPIWIGFVVFGVCGLVGGGIWAGIKYY